MTSCDIHPGPEAWRPVPGASGYEVSDRGGFRSVDRVSATGARLQGKPVPARVSNKGYALVDFTRDDGRRVTRTVHTVLLEAFRGPCPRGSEACHLDDVSLHNCAENLEWNSHPVNVRQRMDNHPGAPPRPQRMCVRCHENPVTRGGKRCHPCVVWFGEQAGDDLRSGRSITESAARLGYPSVEGLQRLAERYGGYGVPPLPGDAVLLAASGHARSRRGWRLVATLRHRWWRGDAA